ncbi:MAG: hypothetical protein PVJ34_18855 [Anaerolineae bacterium]|jgi:hypothetical protein
MQRKFSHAFHVPGTLTANINIRFTVPSDCSLVHVSAVASNASSATLTVGDSSDTDEYLTANDVGDSNTPAEYDYDDFVDSAGDSHGRYYPHISDGTIVVVTIDYDGASGTAAQDLTVVLTFVEG